MNPSIQKLAIKLKDADLAALLVHAGFTSPSLIKRASDRQLLDVRGVGGATLAQIREKFPERAP